MNLNDSAHFARAKGHTTFDKANARLQRAFDLLDNPNDARQHILHFVMQRKDGMFVPVAVISNTTHISPMFFCNHGVYTTSA